MFMLRARAFDRLLLTLPLSIPGTGLVRRAWYEGKLYDTGLRMSRCSLSACGEPRLRSDWPFFYFRSRRLEKCSTIFGTRNTEI